MPEGLLPLFPLQVVLFPGGQLPLHIFEERYKEMMSEAIRDKTEFGIVLASDKGIVSSGCSATIDRVLKTYPDGRMDILTMGRRRFEILLVNEERSFLRGAVEFFDDEEGRPVPPDLQQRAIDSFHQLQKLQSEVPQEALPETDPHLSFRLAQSVPDLSFRQVLLSTRSEAERIRQLADFLPAYLIRQKRIQHVKTVAPTNGHGRLGDHE